jgi:hypothetical protein
MNDLYQAPVVRFPGTGWFSLVSSSDLVKRLNVTLVGTHEAENRPITIEKERMVLIDTDLLVSLGTYDNKEHSEILVPLVIKRTDQGIPVFMSTAIMPSMHYLNSIETEYGLLELLNAFIPIKDPLYWREFYINRIVCKNDVGQQAGLFKIESNGTIVLEEVVILNNASHPFNIQDGTRYNGMIFKNSGISYEAIWNDKYNNTFLSQGILPNMKKISEYQFKYPFQDKISADPKLKKLFETLKEHGKKQPPVPVETRPEEFKSQQKKNNLIDRLNELEAALKHLVQLIGSSRKKAES